MAENVIGIVQEVLHKVDGAGLELVRLLAIASSPQPQQQHPLSCRCGSSFPPPFPTHRCAGGHDVDEALPHGGEGRRQGRLRVPPHRLANA
eukprot:1026947-Prymnesium_polylepis.1